jgi:hypothetical protein
MNPTETLDFWVEKLQKNMPLRFAPHKHEQHFSPFIDTQSSQPVPREEKLKPF